MKTDVLIIGGGLSGLFTGILLLEKGYRVIIVSKGEPGLSFSSGNISLYKGKAPFENIKNIENKLHPYKKGNINNIKSSIETFKEILKKEDFLLHSKENENYNLITSFGFQKEVYLAQDSMKHSLKDKKILITDIKGYFDFSGEFIKNELQETYKDKEFFYKEITLDIPQKHTSIRSKDIARFLLEPEIWNDFKRQLEDALKDKDVAYIPAILCVDENFIEKYEELKKDFGDGRILEIPTSPPSVSGERLKYFLRKIFIKSGGEIIDNSRAISSKILFNWEKATISSVYIEELKTSIEAKYFILAAGGFFSGGLKSEMNRIYEPIFNSIVECEFNDIEDFSSMEFRDFKNHKFLYCGVKTDESFRVYIGHKTKELLAENLFAVGYILSHYNPLYEDSGGGVSIYTAYEVSRSIENGG